MELEPSLELEQQVTRIQAVCRGKQARAKVVEEKGISPEDALRMQQTSDGRRSYLQETSARLGVSSATFNSSEAMQQANEYIQRYKILDLMDTLLAQAVLNRPEDLKAYLIQVLQDMAEQKRDVSMGPFTLEDIDTMFDMWDEPKVGTIPASKLVEHLKALQLSPDRAQKAVSDALGTTDSTEQVSKSVFVQIVRNELETLFSTKSYSGA